MNGIALDAIQQFLWNCSSCLQKPYLRADLVCVSRGLSQCDLDSCWLRKPHQGMVNTTSGVNSFRMSRLSQYPFLPAHGCDTASKGAYSTDQRGEAFLGCALLRASSDIFFLFPSWMCCQNGLSYTTTKCRFKRKNWAYGAIQSVATNVEFVGTCLHNEMLCDRRGGGKCLGNAAETAGSKVGCGSIHRVLAKYSC